MFSMFKVKQNLEEEKETKPHCTSPRHVEIAEYES